VYVITDPVDAPTQPRWAKYATSIEVPVVDSASLREFVPPLIATSSQSGESVVPTFHAIVVWPPSAALQMVLGTYAVPRYWFNTTQLLSVLSVLSVFPKITATTMRNTGISRSPAQASVLAYSHYSKVQLSKEAYNFK